MKLTMTELWNDDRGFLITAELVVIGTLLVLGLVVGLTSVQTALVSELSDVGQAIGGLDQTYVYRGFSSRSTIDCHLKSFTSGSAFFDTKDACDDGVQSLMCDESPNWELDSDDDDGLRDHDDEREGHKDGKRPAADKREGTRNSNCGRVETTQVATAK